MTIEPPQTLATSQVIWRDYYELTKPNVVALMILCSAIGMFMAVPGMVAWDVLILGNLGIALCAGAAAAVNHLVDRHVDLIMARTHDRPIAQGRISTVGAVAFVCILAGSGMSILFTQIKQNQECPLELLICLSYMMKHLLYWVKLHP